MDRPRAVEADSPPAITITNSREFRNKPYILDDLAHFMASTSHQEHVTSGGVASLTKEQAARNLVEEHTYLAMQEGRCVGYLNMVPGPEMEDIPSFWLNGFYVAPQHRDQRIGSQLWNLAVREHQYDLVYLDTMNPAVKTLAEKTGFMAEPQFAGRQRIIWALNMAQLVAHPKDYLLGVARDMLRKSSNDSGQEYAMYVRFPSTWQSSA